MGDLPAAVCVVGPRGSGKSTAAQLLHRHGFWLVSAGEKNRELAQAEGCSLDTASLQDFGLRLLAERGANYFASVLSKGVEQYSHVVFEGVRSPDVVASLKHRFPTMKIVFILATPEQRRKRIISRGDDPKFDTHPIESYSDQFYRLGAEVVANSGDIQAFEQALMSLIKVAP